LSHKWYKKDNNIRENGVLLHNTKSRGNVEYKFVNLEACFGDQMFWAIDLASPWMWKMMLPLISKSINYEEYCVRE